jgi:hypothetical protein
MCCCLLRGLDVLLLIEGLGCAAAFLGAWMCCCFLRGLDVLLLFEGLGCAAAFLGAWMCSCILGGLDVSMSVRLGAVLGDDVIQF